MWLLAGFTVSRKTTAIHTYVFKSLNNTDKPTAIVFVSSHGETRGTRFHSSGEGSTKTEFSRLSPQIPDRECIEGNVEISNTIFFSRCSLRAVGEFLLLLLDYSRARDTREYWITANGVFVFFFFYRERKKKQSAYIFSLDIVTSNRRVMWIWFNKVFTVITIIIII